jgi:molecular chaperone GrpE
MSTQEDEDDELEVPVEPASEDGLEPPAASAELKDKWLRALAELENVRRASRIESEQVRRYGAAPLLAALLGVLDNLQRALAAPPAGIDADYLAGLQLIERQFTDALTAHGVLPIPAQKGQRFDPTVHRALMEQESDEVEPGSILTLVVPGYRLHDRLLREAQVVVARAPQGAEV